MAESSNESKSSIYDRLQSQANKASAEKRAKLTSEKSALDAAYTGKGKDPATISKKKRSQEIEKELKTDLIDARSKDIMEGVRFGENILGPEGLGRLGQSDTMDAMSAQAAEMAKGFSSEESLARQEKGLEGIQGSTASQSRAAQAALARSGVKGQAAGAQLGQIAMSGVQARGNLERDLIIANRDAQMQGLQAQSNIFGQAQERQKFDISQAAKEKDIQLQAGLGFAQMGSTERAAEANRQAQIQAARAGKQKSCFVQGTKVMMYDGSFKNIEDIKIADKLMDGGIVYSLNQGITDGYYIYNDTLVTGSHTVLEEGDWKHVKDAKLSVYVESIAPVYNLSCENHVIITKDETVFADYDEVDCSDEKTSIQRLEELNGNGSKVLERGRGV